MTKRKANHTNNITRPADMVRYRTGGATQNHAQRGAATRAMALLPAGKQYAATQPGPELVRVERWHELAAIQGTPLVFTPMEQAVLKALADAVHYSVAEWGAKGEEYQRKAMLAAKAYADYSILRSSGTTREFNLLPPPSPKPVKVDSLIKDLRTMQALLPQALQDKAEVKPTIDKSLLVHDTETIEFPALETELGQARWQKHRHELEACTYHWSNGWGRMTNAQVQKPLLKAA